MLQQEISSMFAMAEEGLSTRPRPVNRNNLQLHYLKAIRSVRLSVEAAFFSGSFSAFALC